jgi:death-on-curing protein
VRYVTREEVLELHRMLRRQSGGTPGLRDPNVLESALAQPQMTFGETELYPDLADKAGALGFSLVNNHPFVDGNKRVGHAVMEAFLVLNGYELAASVDEQEALILRLAAGEIDRSELVRWLRSHLAERRPA